MNTAYVVPVLIAVLLILSGSFAVDITDSQRPAPVAFDDTIRTGTTAAVTAQARADRYHLPKAQAFYSQYPYALGYYGVGSLVDELNRAGHQRQFGRLLAIYVTDYAEVEISLTTDGYIRLPNHPAGLNAWTPAEEAVYVIGSRARTPGGAAILPFSDRDRAKAFADRHGGHLRDWSAVRESDFGTEQATRDQLQTARRDRTAWADQTVSETRALLERPVSVKVGEDTATVQAAIDRAPPNTTIELPAGTFPANLTIDKPVTLRGAGAATHLRGDGNGSVLLVTAPRVAIADLRITGVGNETSVESIPGNTSEWDYNVKLGYAYGDAGIVFDRANGSLVHAVSIETPANSLLFRWSDRSVVDEVTVNGSHPWMDGFMGVMNLESRLVVQESSFRHGRDGVYTHQAHGVVIRNNRMTGMRFGVHEMYTSNALVTNNTVADTMIGLVVMTRPTGNILADNQVRTSEVGISVAGSSSFVVENTLQGNGIGLYVSADRSLYEQNLIIHNDVGLRASTLVPTNRVVANDVVRNERSVVAILGPLRLWSGNYWAEAPGFDRDGDGTLDRSFYPSGPVDSRIGRTPGAATLARSPAVILLRELRALVPGLQATGVGDLTPRAAPVRPERLRSHNTTGGGG